MSQPDAQKFSNFDWTYCQKWHQWLVVRDVACIHLPFPFNGRDLRAELESILPADMVTTALEFVALYRGDVSVQVA